MDTQIRYDKHEFNTRQGGQLRDLGAGDTHWVIGSRGTVVRCVTGRLWVTQEGDPRDYVVPAGARFCAGGSGRIVASAVAEHTSIAVYRITPQPLPYWSRNAVRIDAEFAESIHDAARQARSRMMLALLRDAWHYLQHGWKRFLQSGNPTPTLRTREGG